MLRPSSRWFPLLVVLSGLSASDAGAQGVTTAQMTGLVTDEAGVPVPSAQISVRNTQTGFQTGALTNSEGRYFVPFLQPGGPYQVTVELIGYATERREGIDLALGQTLRLDFQLRQEAVQLEGLVVESDPVFSQDRTGQQTVIGEAEIENLPTLTRNFTELATLSPLVQGTSVQGMNNRFNQIRIDGAVNNDVFGLADSGVPGGQANGKPIAQDAIAEFQVVVAPFDVRQSGFTGGLINAVTKSGTNEFHGSLYGFFRNESFEREELHVGDLTFGNSPFDRSTLGFTLGGPIVQDRLHFFVSGEFEDRSSPNSLGLESGSTALQLAPESVEEVREIAEGQYDLPFGRTDAYANENPARNLFGRLDWQLSAAHTLSVKHSFAGADDDDSPSRGGSFFEPESATYDFENTTHTTVAQLFSRAGRWNNEALLNVQFIRDRRAPAGDFRYSTVRVSLPEDPVDPDAEIRFGAERFSHANELDQDILQLTNNLTGTFGAHRVTFGMNAERWSFRNLFVDQSLGEYNFDSPEDFAAGNPDAYFVRLLHPSFPAGATVDAAAAEFAYWQVGGYVQDEFAFNRDLTLTAGLRVDVPFTPDEPRPNPDFESEFGISTTGIPTGNPLIQPRFGFNYLVRGDTRNQVRGGAGIFAGRVPFVWMSNAFGNTGRETVSLACFGDNTPDFQPRNAPTTCADGSGAAEARASVNLVDPDFKFPQELKVDLAWDREWGDGWRTTMEGIYTKAIDQIVTEEVNSGQTVVEQGNTEGIGPRTIYGTPIAGEDDPWDPVLVSEEYLDVVRMTNASDGYTYALIGEIAKRWDLIDVRGSYTYSRSYDLMSLTSSRAISNFGFNPVGESARLGDRPVTPSNFDVPHRIVGTATAYLFPDFGGTTISLIYRGSSGLPYQYVYDGDVNGDGYAGEFSSDRTNDLVYVPENSSEIAWRSPEDEALFNELVSREECLQEARGGFQERNACRNPWQNQLDLRLTQGIEVPAGRVQLLVDVFNVLNLLNEDWGVIEGSPFNTVQLLRTFGRENDDPDGRVVLGYDGFQVDGEAVRPFSVSSGISRWRVNLGLRYIF